MIGAWMSGQIALLATGGTSANGVTTDVVNTKFQGSVDAVVNSAIEISGAAGELLFSLALLELIVFFYLAWLDPDEDIIEDFVRKLMMIAVIGLLTMNWGTFANYMRGYIVGPATSSTNQTMSVDPATVANKGVDKIAVIFNEEARTKLVSSTVNFGTGQYDRLRQDRLRNQLDGNANADDSWLGSVGFDQSAMIAQVSDTLEAMALEITVIFVFVTLALMTIFVHFYVALQIFSLTVDWYITVAITNLFIPFAVNKHLSPIATSALNAVVGKSVQLAVLLMVVSIFDSMTEGSIDADPTLYEMLALLLEALMLAFIVHRAPSIADSIYRSGGNPIDLGGAAASVAGAVASSAASALTPRPRNNNDDDDNSSDKGKNKNSGKGDYEHARALETRVTPTHAGADQGGIGVGAASAMVEPDPSELMSVSSDGSVTSGQDDVLLGASHEHAQAVEESDDLNSRVSALQHKGAQASDRRAIGEIMGEIKRSGLERSERGAIGEILGDERAERLEREAAQRRQMSGQERFDKTSQMHAIDTSAQDSSGVYDVTRQMHAIDGADSTQTDSGRPGLQTPETQAISQAIGDEQAEREFVQASLPTDTTHQMYAVEAAVGESQANEPEGTAETHDDEIQDGEEW